MKKRQTFLCPGLLAALLLCHPVQAVSMEPISSDSKSGGEMWLLAGAVPEALRTKQAPSRREDKELAETRAKAEAGDPPAANRLGVWYEKGRRGLPARARQILL